MDIAGCQDQHLRHALLLDHITDSCQAAIVLTSDMRVFACDAGRISHCNGPRPAFPCPYVRLSFVMAPEEDIPKGMQRLANVLKRVQSK